MGLLSLLLVATISFYPSVTKTWNSGRNNYDLRSQMSQARDLMTGYLIKASTFTVINPGRIIFTADIDPSLPGPESCILYLYNPNDGSWPAAYPYATYELRFMTYAGVPVFGGGRSIFGSADPANPVPFGLDPTGTIFSNNGNQLAIKLTGIKDTETFGLSFEIHPRNL